MNIIKKHILLFLLFSFSLKAIDWNKCYSIKNIEFFIKNHQYVSIINSISLYTLDIDKVKVDVYIPELNKQSCYKTLLVLPGWKFSRKKWFKETRLLKFIKKYQYIAIAPEMNISIYESQYFKETKLKWHKKPGMQFIEEDLLPYFKTYGLFNNNYYNMGLGLSTGARGIVLIASRNPDLFYAIAALAGDYDQTLNPKDNLIRLTYGEYHLFKNRWETIDNPIYNIQKNGWNTHIYIGHGLKDTIVSYKYSKHLYQFLKSNFNNKIIVLHLCNDCKHDFSYWDSELEAVFNFYENNIKTNLK